MTLVVEMRKSKLVQNLRCKPFMQIKPYGRQKKMFAAHDHFSKKCRVSFHHIVLPNGPSYTVCL